MGTKFHLGDEKVLEMDGADGGAAVGMPFILLNPALKNGENGNFRVMYILPQQKGEFIHVIKKMDLCGYLVIIASYFIKSKIASIVRRTTTLV